MRHLVRRDDLQAQDAATATENLGLYSRCPEGRIYIIPESPGIYLMRRQEDQLVTSLMYFISVAVMAVSEICVDVTGITSTGPPDFDRLTIEHSST